MRLKIIFILVLSIISFLSTAENTPKSLSFAVVPQQSAQRLAALWGPVLNNISQQTGIKLQFKTAKNIPEFERQLSLGNYDFAYMNPYHFTVFNQSPGYKAIAVRKEQPIKGIIIVAKDSPIKSITALNQKTMAFPSPAAFAASILPRANLKQKNITITPRYVSSHDSVYLNIAKGIFPAGGGVQRTFNNTRPEVRDKLKVLWTSVGYTPHAIAVHPKIDKEIQEKIQNALINLNNSVEGRRLLATLKIKKGLINAKDSDWDDVRSLKLQELDKLSQNQ